MNAGDIVVVMVVLAILGALAGLTQSLKRHPQGRLWKILRKQRSGLIHLALLVCVVYLTYRDLGISAAAQSGSNDWLSFVLSLIVCVMMMAISWGIGRSIALAHLLGQRAARSHMTGRDTTDHCAFCGGTGVQDLGAEETVLMAVFAVWLVLAGLMKGSF